MARERVYSSSAERVAAHRARKRAELEVPELEVEPAPVSLPVGRPAPDVEWYVAETGRLARMDAVARHRVDVEPRVAAAERYARWRHAGFLAGQVASL